MIRAQRIGLRLPATVFCKRCQAEKWEIGHYVGLLLFADNCWLVAMPPAELRCVALAWNELLVRAGLRMAWKEAVWCTSAPLTVWRQKIEVHDTEISRTAREQGFKALVAWITLDDHFVKELTEREVIAWKSFYHLGGNNYRFDVVQI